MKLRDMLDVVSAEEIQSIQDAVDDELMRVEIPLGGLLDLVVVLVRAEFKDDKYEELRDGLVVEIAKVIQESNASEYCRKIARSKLN